MKTFKVIDGRVKVDGVLYGQTPNNDVNITGKSGGRIHSINIQDKGQFFPIAGLFNDGSIKVTDDNTGIVEPTTPIKKRATKKATK